MTSKPDEIDAIVDAVIERGSPTLDRIIAERDELRASVEALLVLNQDLRAEVERRSDQHEIDNGVQEKLYEERDDALHQVERLAHEVERLTLADRQWADHVKRLSEANESFRLSNENLRSLLAQSPYAELERLKAAVVEIGAAHVAAQAEAERLRETLEQVADASWPHDPDAVNTSHAMQRVAAKALGRAI